MRLPWRRDADAVALPESVVAAAGLRRRDVLAAAPGAEDQRWVLATTHHLVVVDAAASGEPVVSRRWVDLDLAEWDADAGRLVVVPSDPAHPPSTFSLEDAGALLVVVRERLSATLVLERHARSEGRQVTVVCRRAPDGQLLWRMRYSAGLDADDPDVRRTAAALLERARDEVGDVAGSP